MTKPGASVVIPTHGRAHLLERCLRALERQRLTPLEVIVIDDGSRDATWPLLQRWTHASGAGARAIHLCETRGPAAARNAGLTIARGELVAFTDDDCEPEPEWLSELTTVLVAADDDVVGVGGRVVADRAGWIGAYMAYHRILEPPPSLAYLVTANCLYRRRPVLAVGGFDDQIRQAGGEDPGLSLRLRDQGYRFAFCERAVVRHAFRESVVDFAQTFFRYGKGCRHVVAG